METKLVDEENEDHQKEKPDSKEVNLETKLVSALEEIDTLRGNNINQKE
jgi:hypothetical protein